MKKIGNFIFILMLAIMFSSNAVVVHAAEAEAIETKEESTSLSGNEIMPDEEPTSVDQSVSNNQSLSDNKIAAKTDVSKVSKDAFAKYNSKLNYEIPTLSYEEYKKALAEGKTDFASGESYDQGKKSVKNITEKTFSLSELNLDHEFTADSSYVDGEAVPMTLPIPNISLFVNNPDSLKNGQPTTKTELIWIYNDSDADGDSIVDHFANGFPEGYRMGWVIENNVELGFVTRFFNPGTYTVNYYILDSNDEINGIRYTIDILTVGDYDIYSGDLSTANEVDSYTVPIDFTSTSTAAIAYVQSGETDLRVTVTDENGNEVTKMTSSDAIARRWAFIERESGMTGVHNYNVSVAVEDNDYHAGSSGYKIMAGSKKDIEEMISYVDNAVLLGKYTAKDSTYDFRTGYTPNNFESYFKFKADGAATVTVMTNYIQTRFKILDPKTMITLYDSEGDNEAHRTQYTSPFSNIEKQRLGFTAGEQYYLVIYANNPISTTFVERTIDVTQGMGVLRGGRDKFSANTSITAGTAGFSPSATISIGSTVPQTAEVKSVSFVSSDGVSLSDIKSFRVKAPRGHTSWRSSLQYIVSIDYPYTADGDKNTPLRGDWLYAFQASMSTKRMTPTIAISYDYEYGD